MRLLRRVLGLHVADAARVHRRVWGWSESWPHDYSGVHNQLGCNARRQATSGATTAGRRGGQRGSGIPVFARGPLCKGRCRESSWESIMYSRGRCPRMRSDQHGRRQGLFSARGRLGRACVWGRAAVRGAATAKASACQHSNDGAERRAHERTRPPDVPKWESRGTAPPARNRTAQRTLRGESPTIVAPHSHAWTPGVAATAGAPPNERRRHCVGVRLHRLSGATMAMLPCPQPDRQRPALTLPGYKSFCCPEFSPPRVSGS